MREIAYKSNGGPVEVKATEGSQTLHIKAYACVFGNIDSWGDIIEPTACDEFLKSADADRMKLCYQHDFGEVIGVITAKGVDALGMWIEGDILDTTTGQDVQKLLKAGAINEFSIGYYALKSHDDVVDGQSVRRLDEISVIEVSPVTRAANPKAILLDAKSEERKAGLRQLTDGEFQMLESEVHEEHARRILAAL